MNWVFRSGCSFRIGRQQQQRQFSFSSSFSVLLLWYLCVWSIRSNSNTFKPDAKSANQFFVVGQQQQQQQKQPPRRPTKVKNSQHPNDNNENETNNNHNSNDSHSRIQSSLKVGVFDKDSRDDCNKLIEHCHNELFAHIYIQCSATCTKYLQQEGMKGTPNNPDEFYEFSIKADGSNKRFSTERFEGYVTIIGIVPLLGGMSAYYYEMFEHVHSMFSPHIETIIVPVDVGLGMHIRQRQNEKEPKKKRKQNVLVLEEETAPETNPLIKYLLNVKPRSGAGRKDDVIVDDNDEETIVQTLLDTDRVNVYIVSADAAFVERLVSPSLSTIQQKAKIYMKTIDYEL